MQAMKAGRHSSQPSGAFASFTLNNDHAVLLEHMNRFAEIARLPLQQQAEPLKELEERLKGDNLPELVQMYAPAIVKVFEAHRRSQAMLECSIVALAAERYRLVHGRWPDSLEQLTPTFLSRVADDPYGKGPIRLGKTQDGLVIYSVYIDGVDNGGRVVPNVGPIPGIDLGVRLWDVKARRQPPPVKAAGDERK